VSGAVVQLTQGTQVFISATDSAGNYAIATPAGSPLSTGTYSILVGNVTQSVNVTSGTSICDFSGVDPFSADNPRFVDSASIQ
jgi:hypothetical protein